MDVLEVTDVLLADVWNITTFSLFRRRFVAVAAVFANFDIGCMVKVIESTARCSFVTAWSAFAATS